MEGSGFFKSFRDRFTIFLLGFLFGIVLGGGFFVLKLDEYVKELALYKSITEPAKEEEAQPAEEKEQNKKKPSKKQVTERVVQNDSTTVRSDSGSISNYTMSYDEDDEIVIRKDEMIATQLITVVNLDPFNATDSLMQKEAGVKLDAERNVTVEFWRSPLNYKGYKMSRSRLVLFGIPQSDLQSVTRLNGITYMRTVSGIYKLEPTAEFRQPERVTDESVLSKIK